MVKQLLEEVRAAPLDEASRERLARSTSARSPSCRWRCRPTCRRSCTSLALPFDDDAVPSEAELRIAKAQLVGWLEGLFHGIQATLFAQQIAARQQLEQMRQLPRARRGAARMRPGGQSVPAPTCERPGHLSATGPARYRGGPLRDDGRRLSATIRATAVVNFRLVTAVNHTMSAHDASEQSCSSP